MKNIKDFILEGAWGYEPDQNDSTLDLRGDIFFSICELIYDKCNDASEHKKWGTEYSWNAIGNIEYFFEELTKMKEFQCGDENEFDKYYYWFRLIDKKKTKNIIDLYERLLNRCKKDEKWINDWKEPEKMRDSLEKRAKNLERYKKLLKDQNDFQKEAEKRRKEIDKEDKQSEEQIQGDIINTNANTN